MINQQLIQLILQNKINRLFDESNILIQDYSISLRKPHKIVRLSYIAWRECFNGISLTATDGIHYVFRCSLIKEIVKLIN